MGAGLLCGLLGIYIGRGFLSHSTTLFYPRHIEQRRKERERERGCNIISYEAYVCIYIFSRDVCFCVVYYETDASFSTISHPFLLCACYDVTPQREIPPWRFSMLTAGPLSLSLSVIDGNERHFFFSFLYLGSIQQIETTSVVEKDERWLRVKWHLAPY